MIEPLAPAAEALAPEDDLAPAAETAALTMDPWHVPLLLTWLGRQSRFLVSSSEGSSVHPTLHNVR